MLVYLTAPIKYIKLKLILNPFLWSNTVGSLEGLEQMPAVRLKGNFPHNKSVHSLTGKLLTVRVGNSAQTGSGSRGPHKVQGRGEPDHKLSIIMLLFK